MRMPLPVRMRTFLVFLTAAGFFGLAMPECRASEASSDPDTPLRVKMVEIKGAKVRLPIPDGYEEMRREDSPHLYDWMVDIATLGRRIPLAYLINSSDRKKIKKDDERIRYSIAFTDSVYNGITICEHNLEIDMRFTLYRYVSDMLDIINPVEREFNKPEFKLDKTHINKRSFVLKFTRKRKNNDSQNLEAMIWSFILLDTKIVEVHFYQFDHEESDAHGSGAYNYLKKIDRGHFRTTRECHSYNLKRYC